MKPISLSPTRRRFLQTVSTGVVGALGQYPVFGNQLTPSRLGGLDDYAEAAMVRWQVPGLAIAVVREGQLVHARGYGVRSVNESAKIDAETVFPLASCTKSFTAAAIAKLIDNGKVNWDHPVAKHLPALRLSDAELTAKVTIRQALGHRTGLPTANMLWRNGAFDRDEIMARLRWLKPAAAQGEKFIYNNVMYLVLGKLVEQISGQTWNEYLRTELFAPLSMKSTFADSSGITDRKNVAAPHANNAGKLQRIDRYSPDVIAPAGAIHSNLLDMAQWLKLHLDGGTSDGRQLISKVHLAEMHTPPQPVEKRDPADSRDPRVSLENYGLGWFFNEQGGRQVVEHSGNSTGFVSWVAMIPEARLGMVILANQHNTGLNLALRIWILDALLGSTPRDWSEKVRSSFTKVLERFDEAKTKYAENHPKETTLPQPLSEFAGRYTSPLYGDVVITELDGRLSLQFGTRFKGELQHWEKESFRAFFPNPRLDDWLVTFAIQDGRITGLRAKESPWAPADYNDADDLGDFHRG